MTRQQYVTYHSAHMLCTLGIPTNILGYPYLQKAIELAIRDSTATANITRDIYVPIASFFNTTPDQVRFEISRAVRHAWECGGREQMQLFFGHGTVKAGANEKFIAAIVGIVMNAILLGKDYEFGANEQGDISVNFGSRHE